MPHRCKLPECGRLVNERKPHVRFGDLLFCSPECSITWLERNNRYQSERELSLEFIKRPPDPGRPN